MMGLEGVEGVLMMEPLAGEAEEAVVDLMEAVEARNLGVQSSCNNSPLKGRIREQPMEERVVQGEVEEEELLSVMPHRKLHTMPEEELVERLAVGRKVVE